MSVPSRRAILAGLALTCGCASSNGASESRPATDYEVGATYELQQDRFIDRAGTLSDLFKLRRPGEGGYVSSAWSRTLMPPPASIADYESDPSRWPSIRGVLRSGAHLRVSRIERHDPFLTLEAWTEVRAEAVDGPFQGLAIELSSISRQDPSTRAVNVDPAELRRIP